MLQVERVILSPARPVTAAAERASREQLSVRIVANPSKGDAMRTAEQYGLDDSAVQAMGRAFDLACARLSRTGVLRASNLEPLQKIAAQQLVFHARRGERNEWRLARRAIFAVCAAVATERSAAGVAISRDDRLDAASF